jgi:hypothetical protein
MVDCPAGAMQSYLSSSAASKTLKVFPQLHLPQSVSAYDFVVWFDNKFSVNLEGVERAVGSWNNSVAAMFHTHPQLCGPWCKSGRGGKTPFGKWCCGADVEFVECTAKQERYQLQRDKMVVYMGEEVAKGYPVHGERHFQTGFIIYNLNHPATTRVQQMWFEHINRCGILCQISFYFVAQRFPSEVAEFTESIES